mmetsp:Transcript_74642/g.230722  ORF Transcript_74642/g.230722 Transcript_74642/m.230722 type:complete len:219 (-) Transcript_74642:32-688(-)
MCHRDVAHGVGLDQSVHLLLALRAEAGRCLVQDHKVEVLLQEQAGKADALNLSQRQAVAPVHVLLPVRLVSCEALDGPSQVGERGAVGNRLRDPPRRPPATVAPGPPATLPLAGRHALVFGVLPVIQDLHEGTKPGHQQEVVQVHHPEYLLQALVIDVSALDARVEELLAQRAYAHVGALRDEEGMPPWWSMDCPAAVSPQTSNRTDEGRLPDATWSG